MDKFTYDKQEINIAKYQCEFCKHKDCTTDDTCSLLGEIPDKVKENIIACDKFSKKGKKYPWEK